MFMQKFIERQFYGTVLTDAWLASKTFGDGCMVEEGQFWKGCFLSRLRIY